MAEKTNDPKARGSAWFALGRAYREQGNSGAAEPAFKKVLESAPGSTAAKESEKILYEMANLGLGHRAPEFSVTSREGKVISLAGFRNQAVVMVFWAST